MTSMSFPVDRPTITERLTDLYKSGELTDCEFLFVNKKKVRCHKIILAMSSAVFKAMLFGPMREAATIYISDTAASAFEDMLLYLYTEHIELVSFKQAWALYEVAKKYLLDSLKDHCLSFMNDNLNADSAAVTYEYSRIHEEFELMEKSMMIIRFETAAVLTSPLLMEVAQETMSVIMDQNDLTIPSELNLFNAVEKWGTAYCAREDVAEDDVRSKLNFLIKKVRFLSMTIEEFCSGPLHSKLLSSEEIIAILKNITRPLSTSLPLGIFLLPRIDTLTSLLNPKKKRLCCGLAYVNYTDPPVRRKPNETSSIKLKSNKGIGLMGIKVSGRSGNPDLQYKEDLEVFVKDNGNIISTSKCKGVVSSNVFDIDLDKPIVLQPYKEYEITVVFRHFGFDYYEWHYRSESVFRSKVNPPVGANQLCKQKPGMSQDGGRVMSATHDLGTSYCVRIF